MHGTYVEPFEAWTAAIDLDLLDIRRNPAAFACLFGVHDEYGWWRPAFPARGLPEDASDTARAAFVSWGAAAFHPTWLGWAELAAVDWDEPALPRATDIVRYRRRPDGSLEQSHREDWSRGFGRAAGIDTRTVDPGSVAELWEAGTSWDLGSTVFRVGRLRRRDLLPEGWPWTHAREVMRLLVELHGAPNVRLVAWFEQ